MFCRVIGAKKISMLLVAPLRRAIQNEANAIFIFRNAFLSHSQINQLNPSIQRLQSRNFSSPLVKARVEEKDDDDDMEEISRILKDKEWCNETEEKLNSLSIPISEEDVMPTLKILKGNPGKALSFFSWYSKSPAYGQSSSSVIHNAMVRVACSKLHNQHLIKLIQEMKAKCFTVETHTLLRLCVRCQGQDAISGDIADMYIWKVEKEKKTPSPRICFKVVECLSNNAEVNVDAAVSVVKAFRKYGGHIDKRIYDSLHRCLAKAGRFMEDELLREEMRLNGFMPDKLTYTHLIFGLCKAKVLDEACVAIHELQKEGFKFDPRPWEVLIQAHCDANETVKALELFSYMARGECEVAPSLVQSLVSHLCSRGREADAHDLICAIVEQKNLTPSHDTYQEVITKLAHSDMMKEACKMFELMKGHRYEGFEEPLCECIARCGCSSDAYSFLTKTGKKSDISGKSCIAMYKAFCNVGKHRRARALVSKLPPHIAKSPPMLTVINETSSDKLPSAASNLTVPSRAKKLVIKKMKKVEESSVRVPGINKPKKLVIKNKKKAKETTH